MFKFCSCLFQRVIDLGPQLREFVASAKQYHKALLSKFNIQNLYNRWALCQF